MKLKLVSKRLGDHVHTQYFMGEEGKTMALMGILVSHVGEWQTIGAALILGAQQMSGRLEVEAVGDEEIVWPASVA